jgi:hypothetical protein
LHCNCPINALCTRYISPEQLETITGYVVGIADGTPLPYSIRWESDYIVITGFERIQPNGLVERLFDYQQTWYITPSGE